MKTLLLNNKSSVTYDDSNAEDIKVNIDGKEHLFEDGNENRIDYAQATKRKKYAKTLNHQFENLVLLTGAGSSIGWGCDGKIGKSMVDLWDGVEALLGKELFDKLLEVIQYNDKWDNGEIIKNLEKVLSMATPAIPYVDTETIDLNECVNSIKEYIKEACKLTLPGEAPHSVLLNKMTKRKVTLPRFKLFTLNYDTMFEQAASKNNFSIIDGFSFSLPRVFSGRNFDFDIVSRNQSRVKEEDNFIEKVFHLYKLHGSINWEKIENKIFQRDDLESPLMIYPHQSKYESSYEQPYFEMMSRFQNSLRKENVFLITIGFSFGDKHIVTSIIEALEQNPSFQLMIINRGIDETNQNLKPFIEAAKKYSNITIVAETFEDFALNYPDLQTYNHDTQKQIVINLPTT
ncbi:SIR2 family protein [Empedobacter falsenii]|uniref:SIR2 family protein n=1 Tax=Empedobacter falsenii TaxID=343874 RepID=UPI002578D68A|nr:SIR2 family protein [Empedobacter falsenii]MDM1299217.1 SIR2 family protein [Empedobacter falsenii]MDM1319121.1 SIR2 family protein [Empedobacter falsenii]